MSMYDGSVDPPDRPRSLCLGAKNARFGLSEELISNLTGSRPNTTLIISVGREQQYSSSDASLLAVSLSLTIATPEAPGVLDVFALVDWTTGKASHTAEVDVQAAGTTFTLVAADAVQIRMRRNTGAGAKQGDVIGNATVGFATAMGGAPQRTQVATLPMARTLIPAFARELVVYPDTSGAITAPPPARVLRFFTDLAAAPIAEMEVPGGGGIVPVRIPNSALFWDVIGAAGAVVQGIFKLSLS